MSNETSREFRDDFDAFGLWPYQFSSSEEEDNQNENELIGKKDFHLYLKTLMKQLERKQSKVDRAIIKLA